MTLRCFLFSSDEGTSDVIRQVLTGLGVEGETCSVPTTAVEKVARELFQLVIVDWDQQPEATMVLSAGRDRRAADRPLSLAIVSDDASVPKALQAGANSVLRKPLLINQVTDTLTTARDLLHSRQESALHAAQAAAAAASAASSIVPSSVEPGKDKTLRAGEFLHSAPSKPGGQFVTESEASNSPEQSSTEPVDPLKDLEPVAAPAPPVPASSDEPRGLEWHLKARGVQRSSQSQAPPPPAPPANGKPDLLSYDQSASRPASQQRNLSEESTQPSPQHSGGREQKKEAELFAYINGESEGSQAQSTSRFGRGKRAIIAALVLAAIAVAAAPQAPWHPKLKVLAARGQRSLHGWLNPQPVTTAQAPTAHEDFGRAGDEYKLPVAENIPDATTDPGQIQVLPAVDPTKKPPSDGTNPDQAPVGVPADTTPAPVPDSTQPSAAPVQENPQVQPAPVVTSPTTSPAATVPATIPSTTPAVSAPNQTPHSEQPVVAPAATAPPPKRQPTPYVPVTTKVPSSLQSQMVVMTPEASGNKPAEAAMQAIEPVAVPELTERTLLLDQPPMSYPPTARGQQGTVILQVLIGRDGAVQDAKFLQGSLAFARTAIDGVKQWKFKPYTMNGRPVSVQTMLTIKFKPVQ
jgi:protein TonB